MPSDRQGRMMEWRLYPESDEEPWKDFQKGLKKMKFVFQNRGQESFFCKGPDNKHVRLCGPYMVSVAYSSLFLFLILLFLFSLLLYPIFLLLSQAFWKCTNHSYHKGRTQTGKRLDFDLGAPFEDFHFRREWFDSFKSFIVQYLPPWTFGGGAPWDSGSDWQRSPLRSLDRVGG